MRIVNVSAWEGLANATDTASGIETETAVRAILQAVRERGDDAVREFAARFDRSSPEVLEVPLSVAREALAALEREQPELAAALRLAHDNAKRFAEAQRAQFQDFELEMGPGLVTGQRILPVQRAAVYVPAGRFPLFSSVLMGAVPAKAAGVDEVVLASPPLAGGLPDRNILAMAALAGVDRVFAMGGAQAIAALAYGTASVPRADVIVGPGNRFVAAAKKLLYGEVGIDFIAGPTDVLVVADEGANPDLVAADLLAQAEHDPDARARALLPSLEMAQTVASCVAAQLERLPNPATARASLDAGGLLLVYTDLDEALAIADRIAPEHLELHLREADSWARRFRNYGSLFVGAMAAEVLGDYSAGINHTLPTSSSARFTGGLSVRHFLKTVTTLRCGSGSAYEAARKAAELIGEAEGLAAHAEGARVRGNARDAS